MAGLQVSTMGLLQPQDRSRPANGPRCTMGGPAAACETDVRATRPAPLCDSDPLQGRYPRNRR